MGRKAGLGHLLLLDHTGEGVDMAESPMDKEMGRLQTTLTLLSDPARLRILMLLGRSPHSIREIADAMGTTKQNIGHHLALMRAAGLLVPERQGKRVDYRIDPRTAEALVGDIRRVLTPGR